MSSGSASRNRQPFVLRAVARDPSGLSDLTFDEASYQSTSSQSLSPSIRSMRSS